MTLEGTFVWTYSPRLAHHLGPFESVQHLFQCHRRFRQSFHVILCCARQLAANIDISNFTRPNCNTAIIHSCETCRRTSTAHHGTIEGMDAEVMLVLMEGAST